MRRTPQGLPTEDAGSELQVTGLSHRRVTGAGSRVDFRMALPTADRSEDEEYTAPVLFRDQSFSRKSTPSCPRMSSR